MLFLTSSDMLLPVKIKLPSRFSIIFTIWLYGHRYFNNIIDGENRNPITDTTIKNIVHQSKLAANPFACLIQHVTHSILYRIIL